MSNPNLVSPSVLEDLEAIANSSETDLRTIVDIPTIITGCSGFIGTWLTLSWVYAHKKFGGSGKLLVTSRNSESNRHLVESINPTAPVTYLDSDIRELIIVPGFEKSFLVHAATPASDELNRSNPDLMLSTIVDGQKQVLLESRRVNVNRFLFLSSGAVYGQQPLDCPYLSEEMFNSFENSGPPSAYRAGKRISEDMGIKESLESGLHFVTARLFAFIAPYLPLGAHFAAGNFIRDAIDSNEIEIMSGGGSVRSYLYATDLCSQLWALLARGESNNAYNVGSSLEVTIKELADAVVQQVNNSANVVVRGTDNSMNVTRYIPCVEKMERELEKSQTIFLDEALARTTLWLRQTGM